MMNRVPSAWNWGINMRTGFGLDVRRIFMRRVSANMKNIFMENFLQPLLVAFVVVFAYLARVDRVESVSSYRETFVYFSTLYGFWIGLFGACQSLNREVQSGEWSYWVLGFRRSKIKHVCAVLFSNLIFALLQEIVFVIAIVSLCFFANCQQNFIEMFVSYKQALGNPIFQMGGCLYVVLSAMFGEPFGPLLMALLIFCFSLFLSVLSGTGFGLMFSAIFKDPAVSLNVSVGYIVLLGMVSLCGLQPNSNSRRNDIRPAFLPEIEACEYKVLYPNKFMPTSRVSRVIKAGRFLPQRYFFNAARLTFVTNDDVNANIAQKWQQKGLKNPYWLQLVDGRYKTLEGPNSKDAMTNWVDVTISDVEDNATHKWLVQYYRDHPDSMKLLQMSRWWKIFWYAEWKESVPILLMFVACLSTTLLFVLIKRSRYEALR